MVVNCSLLLDAGCDVNRRTREGTALHEAVAKGHVDVVSLLLTVSTWHTYSICYVGNSFFSLNFQFVSILELLLARDRLQWIGSWCLSDYRTMAMLFYYQVKSWCLSLFWCVVVWMRRQMWTKHSLSACRSIGGDPPKEYHLWSDLFWHGTVWGRRCSQNWSSWRLLALHSAADCFWCMLILNWIHRCPSELWVTCDWQNTLQLFNHFIIMYCHILVHYCTAFWWVVQVNLVKHMICE